jgi:flagellum-specific ATP synthase
LERLGAVEPLTARLARVATSAARVPGTTIEGRVVSVSPLSVDIAGLTQHLAVGARLHLHAAGQAPLLAEVVSARGGLVQAAPFGVARGIGVGAIARAVLGGLEAGGVLAPDDSWLGRVIDPLGLPLDGLGGLTGGATARPVRAMPPPATARARLGPRIDLGVAVLNLFATCRTGQRLGLFSGSGIGKSTLLAMLARHTACDVAVLALVGERGREVREFLEDDLGAEGLRQSVTVVATSDAPPLLRREAAYAAMTIAEHFRDEGRSVLLLMDSVTRFCLSLREIGLAAGEPPATRGYPPSVFAELPMLLERAGPGPLSAAGAAGHITALFTVLVEGDDHEEPVADAVRGILDGHVVLDRRVAEAGRYPAVDVLRSLSRAAASCLTPEQGVLVRRARALLATYADMADMVRLGAYKAGADAAVDEAVRVAPRLHTMLSQGRDQRIGFEEGVARLASAMAAAS